jgi:hypothetical protein
VAFIARELWFERNARVFHKVAVMPLLNSIDGQTRAEFELWKNACVKVLGVCAVGLS